MDKDMEKEKKKIMKKIMNFNLKVNIYMEKDGMEFWKKGINMDI